MPLDPASIRYNNPGAMWPGPSSQAYGATGVETIGGGNKIAIFPDPVSGAAAQFDLLGRKYSGKTVADAIGMWSGGNHVDSYLKSVAGSGVTPDTVITREFLASPGGVTFARSMARHEAGRDYPLSDEQWTEAQSRAFGGVPPQGGVLAPEAAATPAAGGLLSQSPAAASPGTGALLQAPEDQRKQTAADQMLAYAQQMMQPAPQPKIEWMQLAPIRAKRRA